MPLLKLFPTCLVLILSFLPLPNPAFHTITYSLHCLT